MKNISASILGMAVLAMLIPSNSHANFIGSDNFNDNSEDVTKWGADSGFGTPAGVLTETNGRVEFRSSGTADTYRARRWKANFGSYTANWDVQLDVVVPKTSGPNGGVNFGLKIWSTSSPNLFVGIEHGNFGEAPEYFTYRGTTPDVTLDTASSGNATTAVGAIRISFNATTKVLTTYYDADGPANGYKWTLLGSYGIAGSGGATGNTNWGMTANSTFTVVLSGFSSGVTAAAGQVYGDNFIATPAPPSDINGDSKPDYVLFNPSTQATAIWYLNGPTLVSTASGKAVTAGYKLVAVADMDQNGHPDYVLFDAATGQTAVMYLNGATYIHTVYGPKVTAGWSLVAVADMDGDGHPDFVLYNSSTRATAIWYLNGLTLTKTVTGPTLPAGWSLAAVTDIDRDGKPDFVLFNSSTRQTAIWYMNGGTSTSQVTGPTLPAGWVLQGMADFDGDGSPDYVLVKPSTGQTLIWYLRGATYLHGANGPTLTAGFELVSP